MVQRFDDGISKFEIETIFPCGRCKGTIPYAVKNPIGDGIRFLCKGCDYPMQVTRKNVTMNWSAQLALFLLFGLFVVMPILLLLGFFG